MYCIVLSMILFSKEECKWCFKFKNLQAWGYQVPPSDETGYLPYSTTILDNNRSATNVLLSFDTVIPTILLLSGSITIHQSHINSQEPTFIIVSSMMNSLIFLLIDDIFWGLYFWIQFQIDSDSFWWNVKIVFERLFLTISHKSKNKDHDICILEAFYFL